MIVCLGPRHCSSAYWKIYAETAARHDSRIGADRLLVLEQALIFPLERRDFSVDIVVDQWVGAH